MTVRKDRLLTSREQEIFELIVQTKTTKEIAYLLFINESTVRAHIRNVVKRLGVKSRLQAVYKLIRLGELKIDD